MRHSFVFDGVGALVLSALFWSTLASGKYCPPKCNCEDEKLRVHCANASLTVIPITLHPRLQDLDLSFNSLKSISSSFFVYRELIQLDVSHNQLTTLGVDNFVEQQSLKVLLADNNMIGELHNKTFNGLDQLEILGLSENYIEVLPPRIFSKLVKLNKLDLSRNRIESVQPIAFDGLRNLKTLLLRDNRFLNIPTPAFQLLPDLVKLDFGQNKLSSVNEEAFMTTRALKELLLDSCGIKTIQRGAFRALGSLTVLNLRDNELLEVPTHTFEDVPRLEELVIGQNRYGVIRNRAFHHLRYLRKLDITSSPFLTRVERGAFEENQDLKRLVIAHNIKLVYIDPTVFLGMSNLKYVSFRGNKLATFEEDLLPWDELSYVDLRDNPLVCNCSSLWLWRMVHHRNGAVQNNTISYAFRSPLTNETMEISCRAPLSLRGRFLYQLGEDDLDCFDADMRRQIIICVVAVAAVLFAAIIVLGIRFREKVAAALKRRWGSTTKEPQYEKTCYEDDTTICHLAAAHQPLKMIPVTEL